MCFRLCFSVSSLLCASRSHRKRSQPRRHKTEDQKSLGDVMAMEAALEDVKVKEELKRGPDLEEEERSKVMEGEGESPAGDFSAEVGQGPSLNHISRELGLLELSPGQLSVEPFPPSEAVLTGTHHHFQQQLIFPSLYGSRPNCFLGRAWKFCQNYYIFVRGKGKKNKICIGGGIALNISERNKYLCVP